MIKISQLQEKDIIDCADGRYLGSLNDIDIDLSKGKIENILLFPAIGRFLKKKEPIAIPWREIRKIGVDVILVDSINPQIPQALLEEGKYK